MVKTIWVKKRYLTLLLGLFVASCLRVVDAAPSETTPKETTLLINQGQLITLKEDAQAVFIADSDIASYQAPSSRSLFIFGRRPGVTSMYVLGKNERVIFHKNIRVQHDVASINQLLKQQFPDSLVGVTSTTSRLIVSGQVDTPKKADQIIQLIQGFLAASDETEADKELVNQLVIDMPNQVNIRVRVAEMERNTARRFGFDGLVNSAATGLSFDFDVGQLGLPLKALDITAGQISGTLEALEEEGLISILAEPNLTSLSGESASFLAGGQFPVVSVVGDNNQPSVEYQNFGVELNVTPTVLSPQRISLKVNPIVSEINESPNIQPGIINPIILSERSANTTVELASGQSFILGGLLYEKENTKTSKIPLLGDIPVLGALFRSERYQRQETELVIIATAYIVEPNRESDLAIPQDGVTMNSHWRRFLTGKILQSKPAAPKTILENGKPQVMGDYGLVF